MLCSSIIKHICACSWITITQCACSINFDRKELEWGDTPNQEMAEPPPRKDHFSAAIHRHYLVYGGDIQEGSSELPTKLYKFSVDREQWWRTTTTGQHPPPGLKWGSSASIENFFYLFGGWDDQSCYNNLYQFDCNNLNWTLLSTIGGTNAPMAKIGCGMVYYNGTLVVFGGHYDQPTGPTQPEAEYDGDRTNEIHQYNLEEGEGA